MKLPNQDYKVIRHTKPFASQSDKSYGKLTITVFFKGSQDDKEYKTHIVSGMKNAAQWSNVLGQIDSKPTVRFDPGKLSSSNIIDADSMPYIVTTAVTPKPAAAQPTPDIFSDEPPLTKDELRGFKMFVQHVEAFLENPDLLEAARQAIKDQQ